MSKRNVKKKYNRILEISEDHKQITLPDSRYYRRNGKYYPSFISEVSSIFDSSKGINILGFHRSSILQDGFEINEKCAS